MFELTINGRVYRFKFGVGFMRALNKTMSQDIDGFKNEKKDVGLRYKIAFAMDGDIDCLIDILDCANKGYEPRITRAELDAYIDDENTDIDALFEKVFDFLRKANATRKTMESIDKAVKAQEEKAAAAE